MPYTKPERRDAVIQDVMRVKDPGDLNFLLTNFILRVWIANPKYNTYHSLKKVLVIDPKSSSLLQELRSRYAHIFTVGDIYSAASCAMVEFERRVVAAYEDRKRAENGDIELYLTAIKAEPQIMEPKEMKDEVTPA